MNRMSCFLCCTCILLDSERERNFTVLFRCLFRAHRGGQREFGGVHDDMGNGFVQQDSVCGARRQVRPLPETRGTTWSF